MPIADIDLEFGPGYNLELVYASIQHDINIIDSKHVENVFSILSISDIQSRFVDLNNYKLENKYKTKGKLMDWHSFFCFLSATYWQDF